MLPYGNRLPGAVYLIDPGDDPHIPSLLRITVAGLRTRLRALKILGKHQPGELAYYDLLRGMALHRASDREQAAACFERYFGDWPSDILGATKAAEE